MAIPDTALCPLAHKAVLREFRHIPESVEARIRECARDASARDHPAEHECIERMGGQHEELFRLRVGDYRAILDYHMGHVRVLLVKHRQTAYREDNLSKARVRSQQR